MEFFSILFSKPTIFSLFGIISITMGIPLGIKTYNTDGPNALGSYFIFGFALLGIVSLVLDRILIQFISQYLALIYQSLIIVCVIISIKYKRRKLIINANSEKTKYFILIENNGVYENAKLGYSFLFNKRLKIRSPINLYNPEVIDLDKIKITPKRLWGSYSVRTTKIQGNNISFFIRMGLKTRNSEVQKAILQDLHNFFDQERG